MLHVHLAAGVLSYISQTARVLTGQPSQLVVSCSNLSIPVSKLLSMGGLLYNSFIQSINQHSVSSSMTVYHMALLSALAHTACPFAT